MILAALGYSDFSLFARVKEVISFSCLKNLWACFYYCGYPVILASQFRSIVSEKYNLGCFETIERKKTEKCSIKIIDKSVNEKNAKYFGKQVFGVNFLCLFSMVFKHKIWLFDYSW
jgi:hypothetical protein